MRLILLVYCAPFIFTDACSFPFVGVLSGVIVASITASSPEAVNLKSAFFIFTSHPSGVFSCTAPLTLGILALTVNKTSLGVVELNTKTLSVILMVAGGKISNGRYTSPLTGSVYL